MTYSVIPFKFYRTIFSCLLLITFACLDKKEGEKKLWLGKKLDIPEVTSNDKKIVVRLIGDCPSCIESIKIWKALSNVFKTKNKNVKLVFYVEIINEQRFNELSDQLNFADYVIFDQKMGFFNKNLLNFPYHLEYQTFLLNEKNEVLIFGNPIVKKELIRKYLDLL